MAGGLEVAISALTGQYVADPTLEGWRPNLAGRPGHNDVRKFAGVPEGIPNGHVHVVKALVQETITNFSVKLADRKPAVGMRCRAVL